MISPSRRTTTNELSPGTGYGLAILRGTPVLRVVWIVARLKPFFCTLRPNRAITTAAVCETTADYHLSAPARIERQRTTSLSC